MTVVLAGDIGGTKALLALAQADGESVRVIVEERFASPEYPGLAPIVREFLAKARTPAAAACFGVPGAVVDGTCRTPNLPWLVTEHELASETGSRSVRLINDFAAAATGVLALPPEGFATLQAGEPVAHGARAVIGAGTGLGQALLFWDGTRYRVNPTEGGHGGFAPGDETQRALLAHLAGVYPHVSVERVVSGPGLAAIYEFLIASGRPASSEVARALATGDKGAVIAHHALAHTDATCDEALDLFVAAYGAEAGNLALRSLAVAGVDVAGGIAPKILPRLQNGPFLAAFRDKGRMSGFMTRFPVRVVLEERVGLLGAALEACRMASASG